MHTIQAGQVESCCTTPSLHAPDAAFLVDVSHGADRLVDFANLDCYLGAAAKAKSGEAKQNIAICNLPNGRSYHSGTGKWSDWFQYANTTAHFPYLNPVQDKSKSSDLVVRILCEEGTSGDASLCRNTPVGGIFNGTAKISMSTPLSDGVTIRFTVDGSEPTDASPVYSGPVLIRNTTKFAARAFMEQPQGYPLLTTRPVFRQVSVVKSQDTHERMIL